MRTMIFSTAALAVLAIGLTSYQANAQVSQPPKQDCEQAAGIQPSAANQDQSCNTVFKDPDLTSATDAELIQSLVNASASLGDGPYVRIDTVPPIRFDYVTKRFSVNNSNAFQSLTISVDEIQDQLGDDIVPAGAINAEYMLSQNTIEIRLALGAGEDPKGGNQILNECPDGVALVKKGGQNQTVTMIGEIDMWKNTIPGDAGSSQECGLKFTADHTINEVVLFALAGPSGLFSIANKNATCAAMNTALASQQGPVSHVSGGYAEVVDGFPPGTNLSACFGTATYCDATEAPGLFNACTAAGAAGAVLGAAKATPAVTSGAPVTPPGLAGALGVTITSNGGDQTTTFSGGESGGSLITCCSF